ncbi:TULIP family P47-like protein [Methylobacterium sp. JK268]
MMPRDFLDGETSTLGWDTSFAIRLPDVNAAIATKKSWPTGFDITVSPEDDYTLQGRFGPWQLIRGGSGGIVMMAVAIESGVMTIREEGEIRHFPMDGATAIVSIKLHYVAPSLARTPAPGSQTEALWLVVNPEPRSDADPAVVLHGLEHPASTPSPYVLLLMKAGLEQWFNANIRRFSHVFAGIKLDEIARDAFQWLKPTYTGYAYLDGPTDEDSFFGVIAMTDNRSADGLPNQLGPNCVPPASRAGFTVGLPRYLEKVVLPGLIKAFPKATASSFSLKAGNTVIVNTASFDVNSIVVNGTTYTPRVDLFELQVVADELQIHTRTRIPISPGIRAIVDAVAYQTIVLVTKPDGSHTLDFKEARPTASHHWIEVDDGVKITQIVVALVGSVAGAASEAFKDTAKVVIAAVIITVVAGVVALIPELIAEVAGGGAAKVLPPIGPFATGATDPVSWPGAGGFTLTEAGLNGAFQFGGNPNFSF